MNSTIWTSYCCGEQVLQWRLLRRDNTYVTHLRVEIESLKRVDGVAVFGHVVVGDLLQTGIERRGVDDRLVVRVVETLKSTAESKGE